MSEVTTKPQLTHDCEACTFLGGKIVDGTFYDYYTCNESIIARFGNDGPEYASMPKKLVTAEHPILSQAPKPT